MMQEPRFIYAGDTVTWTRAVDGYPAPTWTLNYTFVRAGDSITVTATASGTEHVVNVAPAVTRTWRPGDYLWHAFVTSGTSRFTLPERGTLQIRPDPAAGGYDTRSTARIMVEMIEAYFIDPNNLKAANYAINNRSLSRWSRSDLLVELDKWKAILASEEAADLLEAGLGNRRRLYVRFDRA